MHMYKYIYRIHVFPCLSVSLHLCFMLTFAFPHSVVVPRLAQPRLFDPRVPSAALVPRRPSGGLGRHSMASGVPCPQCFGASSPNRFGASTTVRAPVIAQELLSRNPASATPSYSSSIPPRNMMFAIIYAHIWGVTLAHLLNCRGLRPKGADALAACICR